MHSQKKNNANQQWTKKSNIFPYVKYHAKVKNNKEYLSYNCEINRNAVTKATIYKKTKIKTRKQEK